jgi:L-asparagine transporter-like permease
LKSEGQAFDVIVERERGLKRGLSSAQMSMIAIGGAIALLMMRALAEMTLAHPTTGSFGAYAEHYLGALAGFLVRYAYWSAYVLAVGTEVTAIAVYMKYWFANVPGVWWIVTFSALLIVVNAASVRAYGAIEYGFSSLKIAAIVAFILLGSWFVWRAPAGSDVGFHNYVAHGGLTLALMLAIVPWTQAGADESPFVKVMAATGVPYAAGAINFVVPVAALSAMNSQLYVTTRMMFSLSRAGHAPRAMARLSRNGVPVNALMLSTLASASAPWRQCFPVLPNPPAPRSLCANSSTTLNSACMTGTTTSCASRSIGLSVNAVWPRFHVDTINWP